MLSTPLRYLRILPSELLLSTVLKSGQSFRWQKMDSLYATSSTSSNHEPDDDLKVKVKVENRDDFAVVKQEIEWSFGWGDRTVCLRQDDQGIYYRSLFPFRERQSYLRDLESDTTLALLRSYFNLDERTPTLETLYRDWSERDSKFKKKLEHEYDRLRGIRVLNQDPWENLISFICSANNNISRITLMVNRVCESLGDRLPHPSNFTESTVYTPLTIPTTAPDSDSDTASRVMYAFPSPTSLSQPSTDTLLRELGFGYRAPYIAYSSAYLLQLCSSLSTTPDLYLSSLKKDNYRGTQGLKGVREELLKFKGVGRKVADCVSLFSLGWTEIVPVDTHVFQIAIRDYSFPASKSTSLTPLLHDKVADRLSSLWGPYAGWAQQVLFFADLKPSSSTASNTSTTKKILPAVKTLIDDEDEAEIEGREKKLSFEEQVEELMRTPGVKRRRTSAKPMIKDENSDIEDERNSREAYPSPISIGTDDGLNRRKKRQVGKLAKREIEETPIKFRKVRA